MALPPKRFHHPMSLNRFLTAQQDTYATALNELRAGWKQGHWMWFVLPKSSRLIPCSEKFSPRFSQVTLTPGHLNSLERSLE